MESYEYLRELNRTSKKAEEKKQRLKAAIVEAEAIGDLTRLNELAALEARTATAKDFAFKNVFELLDGQLTTMAGAMSFECRVELCAYLGFLKNEYDHLIEQAPSEWRKKEIKQLMNKEKEIKLLLNGETDYEVNNDTESQASTDLASAKVIESISSEIDFSGLLNVPGGVDDWFEVIDAMTKAFHSEYGCNPTKAQAWAQLCTNPPIGYGIKPDKDNLSLTMPGVIKPLNVRSFGRRWDKYTSKSNPFKPN